MKAIISSFTWLIDTIKTLIGILMSLITSIIYALQYIQTLINRLIVLIGQMPPWISGFMMATLVISVVYIIIGRQGGKN